MATRILCWTVLIGMIAYDIAAALLGWPTISEQCRKMDHQTGTLLRWAWLAVWCHLFIQWGR
jgi:hypothetical protein